MSFRAATILTVIWTLLVFQLPGSAQEAAGPSDMSAELLQEKAWQSHIEAMPAEASPDDFQQTLDALRSVEFKAYRPSSTDKGPEAEAADQQPIPDPLEPAGLSEEDLAWLETVPSENVQSPELVAEALFRSGRDALAGRFYKMAADIEMDESHRAWLTFMAANCYREAGSDKAISLFEQVAGEFPDTNWARLAKTQQKIIEWQVVNNVAALLDSAEATEQ